MSDLRISPSFSLPLDFVTWTQAILAKKGSGKSYTASVQAEELLEAGQQIIVIDPTGAWHGLRSTADGKSAGFSIAVLGGEHGDVPLEAAAGEVIADAIATEHFSAILDLSLFRKGEALRFMAVFLETLYRRNREALHLFIDEADVVAPQKTFGPEQARVLGATEDIVRRGRIRGIGCTLITQRPQVVNKDVLSQVDMLTVLKMNHPKDLGAIDDWVGVHGDPKLAQQLRASLPSLPIGDAWIWAPAENVFERVTIRRRRTFDSGRTPKAGERIVAPKVLAQVDIARLGATIAATAEQVKQNDPKALKERVAQLERQLRASVEIETVTVEKVVEVPVLRGGELERLKQFLNDARQVLYAAERFSEVAENLAVCIKDIEGAIQLSLQLPVGNAPPPEKVPELKKAIARMAESVRPAIVGHTPNGKPVKAWPGPTPTGGTLVPAQQRIVDTIATLSELGVTPTRDVVAAWVGQHPRTKGFINNMGALRSAGLVDDFALTEAGRRSARAKVPKSRAELHEMLLRPLPPKQREIVGIVIERGEVGREELAEALDSHPRAKGFINNIGALRSRALLTDGWPVRPERVFEAGAR